MTKWFVSGFFESHFCHGSKTSSLLVALILFFSFRAHAELTADLLEQRIAQKLMIVEEFKFIRETAEEMGLRVWLFGGTAAGYAHYAKQDALREQGDKRFQSDHFDYDFTNIYRSTQDLDVVADGTPEQIDQLQKILSDKYQHFLGGKLIWEVRSLRHSRGKPGDVGYKEALLNDFDFLNQNTDSNSTGMIEITQSQEPIVRDLRDWNALRCQFFNDVLTDRNHFYRSSKHFQTARAKAGLNPEIFAVVRALTKAFQYELTFSDEETRQMQEIIDEFSLASIQNTNAKRRLIGMGKKLFKHSVNIEYAWNTLEKMGLRKKLMQFDSAELEDSLAWWMNKEPLRSFEVGTGDGKTAAELGISVIAHEANTFLAYESISRAHTGDANFVISRKGFSGENAEHGNGSYSKIGREGARGTGFTVRMDLNPQAREGTDFFIKDNYVILQNKKAVRVIPESIDMSMLEYFKLLAAGKAFPKSERALLEKFKRRWSQKLTRVSADDLKEIVAIVTLEVKKSGGANPENLQTLSEFFSLSISKNSDILFEELINTISNPTLIGDALGLPHWTSHPKWKDWMISLIPKSPKTVEMALQAPGVIENEDARPVIEKLIDMNPFFALQVLAKNATKHPEYANWVYKILVELPGGANLLHVKNLLLEPRISNSPHWAKIFKIAIGERVSLHLRKTKIFTSPEIYGHPKFREILDYLIAKRPFDREEDLSEVIFGTPGLPDWEKYVEVLVKQNYPIKALLPNLFLHPKWPQLIEKILSNKSPRKPRDISLEDFAQRILMHPKASQNPHGPQWQKIRAAACGFLFSEVGDL